MSSEPVAQVLENHAEKMLSAVQENNKQARKRNRLAKKQYRQSVLNYEQVERQYLLEKSALQPSFRLSITEFLTCDPEYLDDPEQAGEARFLAKLGVGSEERVLRFKIHVKGDAEYMRPTLVLKTNKTAHQEDDERAYSMSELLYFIPAANLDIRSSEAQHMIELYLVYRDRTTLPVIHKYQLKQQRNSTLLRWEAAHLDTVYASSHKNISALNSSAGCAVLFSDREEAY